MDSVGTVADARTDVIRDDGNQMEGIKALTFDPSEYVKNIIQQEFKTDIQPTQASIGFSHQDILFPVPAQPGCFYQLN